MRKLLSTTIAVGILASMGVTPVLADVSANTLPSFRTGDNVLVTTDNATHTTNIKITDESKYAVGTAHWNSFNIGKDATVNVEFTNHHQTSLNFVDAAGGLSQIYGKITDSGCNGCGFAGTGKIVLVNPNGFLFGDGASVNVNSFTASTLGGTYNKDTQTMNFTKGDNTKSIEILDGAKIYGDKNVALVSDNINMYKGSQITTNRTLNIDNNNDGINDTALGKVKLVTADGVNFTYYNNGAIDSVSTTASADKMTLHIEGDIYAGHIDARNMSNHADSEINIKNAVLKAYKAEQGNDGNIWLTANNKVITEKTDLITVNDSSAAASKAGGNVRIKSGAKTTLNADSVDAVGDVNLIATNGDVNVFSSAIKANNVNLDASNVASIQGGSNVNAAKDVTVKGTKRGQITGASKVNADNITVEGGDVWFDRADLTATNDIKATASTGYILADGASAFDADEIVLDAKTNVTGTYDLKNNSTKITAGNDIDVTLNNVSNRNKGLVATADKNVTITTPGTLSVSSLIAKNGNMTLNANKVIAGKDYVADSAKIPGDTADNRSFISVENGTFTSNTPNDPFYVTASDTPIDGTSNYMRHHIQYGNGTEKIVLRNPRPYVQPPVPEPEVIVTVDDRQASMLNKVPRQPEPYNNSVNIADGRTTFVDVFAAASQIEIEDDEE